MKGVGLRVMNGGCKFKREERRVGVKGDIRKFLKPRTTPSARKVKFTPKYIIVGDEGRVSQIFFW